ncbi:MAG: histidine kinase [Lachnospiraceae bacterium]|nr:histidine kinase [Lachnospiraceae bacterium]
MSKSDSDNRTFFEDDAAIESADEQLDLAADAMNVKKKKRRGFGSFTLKQKLRRLFTVTLILYVLCIGFLFVFIYQNQIVDTERKTVAADLQTIGQTIQTRINNVNEFMLAMTGNDVAKEYFTREDAPSSEDMLNNNAIARMMAPFEEVSSVFLIRFDYLDGTATTEPYSKMSSILRLDRDALREKREILEDKRGGYVVWLNGDGIVKPQRESVMCMLRVFYDAGTQRKVGIICATFELSQLINALDNYKADNREYIFYDHNGDTIYVTGEEETLRKHDSVLSAEQSRITKGLVRRDIYATYEIPKTGIRIACVEHYVLWESLSYKIMVIPLISVALMVLALIMLDMMIRRYITRPILKLSDSMQAVKKGWLRRVSMETNEDEIGMLKESYNEMLVEMNRLIEELLDKEKSVRKTEINILQQQIKPHFLYNTIEMIASLAIDDETPREQVYDALETLGSFYRQFLSKGSNEVPLSTELEIAKKYLKLQKLRYGDIFDDEYEIADDCLERLLPKLTIQPLIENSLYHGIRKKGGHGLIRLRVYKENDLVYVELYDDGVGMSEEKIAQIMEGEEGQHFGLRRTIERFCYFEETNDCYKIESKEGEYTKITLILRYK